MTLVAALNVNDSPFLIGDIALTIDLDEQKQTPIPTLGFPNKPIKTKDDGTIINLTQKIMVITPNLAIGWTGRIDIAREIIQDISAYFNPGDTTLNDFNDYWEKLNHPEKNKISIFGMVKHGSVVTRFGPITQKRNLPNKTSAYFGGSGSEQLYNLIQNFNFETFNKITEKPTGGVLALLNLIGVLIGEEINTGKTLNDAFGGGFEIIALFKEGFAKVRDVTFVFWELKLTDSNTFELDSPRMFLKMDYLKDVLIFHRFSKFGNMNTEGKDEVSTFYIGSFLNNAGDKLVNEANKPANFNSMAFCHLFECSFPDGTRGVKTLVDCGDDRLIKIQESQNKWGILPCLDFNERLSSMFQKKVTPSWEK